MSGVTTAAAVVGAAAAVGGGVLAASQANKANKEANRQKSIAADQQAKQDQQIADQKKMADDEEAALQKEIMDKQRSDQAANDAVVAADQVQKRRNRGKRALTYADENGVAQDTLGA